MKKETNTEMNVEMMKDIKLVIFDWDGTLFNSIQSIVDSLQFTAHQFTYTISDQQAKDVIGLALPIALQTLFPTDDEQRKAQILQTYIEHNIPHSQYDQWYDGAFALLNKLQQQGLLLAVATGKARKGLERVFDRLQCEHLFAITRCADEAESKPSPLMLQQILQELNLQPHQALMVGDSIYDMQMAKAIAMPCIGITHGVHQAEFLQPYSDSVVHNIDELAQILLNLHE